MLFFDLGTTTAIRRASSLTFDVRDLEYGATLGVRTRPNEKYTLSWFVEQWGKDHVDADGTLFLRTAGAAVETPGYRTGTSPRTVEGRAAVAVVLDHHGLDAIATLRADARVNFGGTKLRGGADARLDVIAGDAGSADWEVGPRIDVVSTPSNRVAFYLHYLHHETPLGLETQGIVLGFEDQGGAGGALPSPPEVRGSVAAGAGDGRGAGRLDLRFLSPAFFEKSTWVVGEFDVNVLTGDDVSELYYLYDVGIETAHGGATEGLYFRHRSNHRLADPGSFVTSVNVVEAGIETPAWANPAALRHGGRFGTWDARARVGILVDTDFGEAGRLHALVGARVVAPRAPEARILPYARVEAEDGQVGRRAYALGFFGPRDLDVRLEYRSDDQFYGKDKTALLLLAGVSF